MMQQALFTDDGKTPREKVDDLMGRAFVLHCEADEQPDTEAGNEERERLRAKAVKLEREADGIVPVEQRRW